MKMRIHIFPHTYIRTLAELAFKICKSTDSFVRYKFIAPPNPAAHFSVSSDVVDTFWSKHLTNIEFIKIHVELVELMLSTSIQQIGHRNGGWHRWRTPMPCRIYAYILRNQQHRQLFPYILHKSVCLMDQLKSNQWKPHSELIFWFYERCSSYCCGAASVVIAWHVMASFDVVKHNVRWRKIHLCLIYDVLWRLLINIIIMYDILWYLLVVKEQWKIWYNIRERSHSPFER